jgi:hypothetical protein
MGLVKNVVIIVLYAKKEVYSIKGIALHHVMKVLFLLIVNYLKVLGQKCNDAKF